MTVQAARDKATKLNSEIVDGIDPQQRRREARHGMTLADAWESFAERMANKSRPGTQRTNISRYQTCLSHWAPRRLSAITRGDVAKLHNSIGQQHGHVSANRAVQLLRAIYNHVIRYCGQNFHNPAAAVELFKEYPRARFLREDELPRFFQAVARMPDETVRDFVLLALWTGQRRANVQAMRWRDLDMNAATWTIPGEDFKSHKSLVVPLSAPALEILQRRWRDRVNDEWVLPGRGKTGHLVEPKIAWERMLKDAGIEGLTLHDLRRTFGSWQVAAGVPLNVVGGSLGHARPETTAIYGRLQLDTIREAVARGAAAMLSIAKKGGGKEFRAP
jgi:integrase